MALQRRAQRAAPTVTVSADVDPFKEKQKLTTWEANIAYLRALVPETKASDEQIKAILLAHPDDSGEAELYRIEMVEKLDVVPLEDVTAPPTSDKDADAVSREMKRLGAMLDASAFNEHADRLIGKAKEDFDGSVLMVRKDILDTVKTNKSFKLEFEPDTWPIGHTNRNDEVVPKALPSGSNLVPDHYYLPSKKKGEKPKLGQRSASVFDGTKYGRRLSDLMLVLEGMQKASKAETDAQPPSKDEYEAFTKSLATLDPESAKAKFITYRDSGAPHYENRTIDATYDRLGERRKNAIRKFQMAHKLTLQEERIDAVDGLDQNFISVDPAIYTKSTKPYYITYSYVPTGETKKRPEDWKKISVSTMCRIDVAKALAMHTPGTNLIEDLKSTVKREPRTDKVRTLNLEAPGIKDVEDILGALHKFYVEPANEDDFLEWINDKASGEINRRLFGRVYKHVNNMYQRHVKAQLTRDVEQSAKHKAEQAAIEAAAFAKGHDQAA